MDPLRFIKLNRDWNAEPNAPDPRVQVDGGCLTLRFVLNHMVFKQFDEEDVGSLVFDDVTRWCLGSTNNEGWYRGHCRYSRIAPAWGEFYELTGADPSRDLPADWHRVGDDRADARHFLFYLRDNTFECMASWWRFLAPD